MRQTTGRGSRGQHRSTGSSFPGGWTACAAELYHTSPVARIFNRLVAGALAWAAAALPVNRRLRVLEVGAGTGATTAAVLPLLPAAHTDYAFTDLSPAFLPAAQERFSSYPFVTYQTLDVEGEVVGQGLSERSYDVLLASHVLHAVRDLPAALRQLKRLLAPGGVLVLVEGLRRQCWLDLTFGLLPGWWKFSDDWRTDYPFCWDWSNGNGCWRPKDSKGLRRCRLRASRRNRRCRHRIRSARGCAPSARRRVAGVR